MKKVKIILFLALSVLLIFGINCGSNSSSESKKNSTPVADAGKKNSTPVADAGIDRSVTVNTTVILNGSKSSDPDGDVFTYRWRLNTPVSSQSALSDSTVVEPTLIPDIAGTYTVTLIVNDGKVDSNPSSITITVSATQISFSNDIQMIFNSFCIGCHSSNGSAPFSLTSSVAYNNLVNVTAINKSGVAIKRVEPSSSNNSILYLKISGSTAGSRMPLGGSSLSQSNMNLIKNWIDEGSKNN